MSYVKPLSPALARLIAAQDGVVSIGQLAMHGFDGSAVYRRTKSGQWQRLLPTILLTRSGTPTRRQLLVAASLWGGPDAAIDGADACVWCGVTPTGFDPSRVHIVVPWKSAVRSCGFVVVRRTIGEVRLGVSGRLRYVDASTAFIVAARGMRNDAAAIDVLSRGLQTGLVSIASLAEARDTIGDKWCRGVDRALIAVGVGIRSPAEKTNRDLILTSDVLPEPLWNQWLALPDGGPEVCADALWEDAAMVQEVLGRRWHAWGEQFETTEARRLRMVAAGLVVPGVTPTQLRRTPAVVLAGLEATYAANAGRGMPPGVRLIDPPEWLTRNW